MIKKQRGVTLIELLIGMMLGLALISGLSQLFVQSQSSFKLQRNLSDMTDDAVFVLNDLTKGLLLAGYAENRAAGDFLTNYDVLNSGISFNGGEFIKGTDNALIYRFKLDASKSQENNSICIVDSYNTNDIVPVYITYKSSDNLLSCKSKTATLPMIVDVEKLVFRYGIHNKAAGTFFYTTATNVDAIDQATGKNNWQNVFVVKVDLVMRSADDNLTKNKAKYKIEDTEYTATDNRLYKVFSKTIFFF